MQHLKHAIRLLTALTASIAALALSSCSDDFWTTKYTITYDRNGHGTLPYTSLEAEGGTVLTSTHLPTLSESGWTFKGWKDTKLGVIEEGDTIQCDLNLVAQWSKNSDSGDNPEDSKVENIAWVSAVVGDGKVTLRWTYPSEDFSTVQVILTKKPYDESSGSDIVGSENVEYPNKTKTFSGLVNGTEYWVRLVAKNKAGKSATTPIEFSATPEGTSTSGGDSGNTGSSGETGSGGSGDSGSTGSGDSGDTGGLIILVK